MGWGGEKGEGKVKTGLIYEAPFGQPQIIARSRLHYAARQHDSDSLDAPRHQELPNLAPLRAETPALALQRAFPMPSDSRPSPVSLPIIVGAPWPDTSVLSQQSWEAPQKAAHAPSGTCCHHKTVVLRDCSAAQQSLSKD
jgi:hypothetical protein